MSKPDLEAVPSEDELLVPWWPDAARILGVGRSTMSELIKDGEVESVKIRNKRLVVRAGLSRYVERLKSTAAVLDETA